MPGNRNFMHPFKNSLKKLLHFTENCGILLLTVEISEIKKGNHE